MELDDETNRHVEFEMMWTAGRDHLHGILADRDRVLGVVLEDEPERAGPNEQTAPDAVGDAVRSEQSVGDRLAIELRRRPNEPSTARELDLVHALIFPEAVRVDDAGPIATACRCRTTWGRRT